MGGLLDLAALPQQQVEELVCLRQRVPGFAAFRLIDRAGGPLDPFPVAVPEVADAGQGHQQAGAACGGFATALRLQPTQTGVGPDRRPPKVTGPDGRRRLADDEWRGRYRIPAEQPPRGFEGAVRGAELTQAEMRLGVALVNRRELGSHHGPQLSPGCQRAIEEARRLDVRIDLHGSIAGLPAIPPRLVPALRLEVVDGEDAGLLVGRVTGAAPRWPRRPGCAARAVVDRAGPRTPCRGSGSS